MLTLKIYCDTSVLPENIDGTDPKSQRESAAMKKLQTYHGLMFGSHIVRYEAANTPNERRFPGPADFARRMDSPDIKTIRGRALDVEIR